ncbi:Uncharacterised protein [Escherichia coli]|uniref:hypothetical protein n=1 Tax=Escherichia coli TaxID=562 RepID=UPI000E0339E1|nr:hypothetical protein [Escherichia coli]STG31065.1 Uncharacterised protein [Escherichia coli]
MAEPVGDLVVDLIWMRPDLTSRWPESGVIFPVRKVMRKNTAVVEQSMNRQRWLHRKREFPSAV